METGADDKAKTQSGDDEADWETQSESEDDESKPQKWKAIEIGDETDVDKLIDTLAMEPALCHFKLEFEKSTKSVQDRAEQYWSVLLAVAYCNSNDKEITIVHNEQQDGLSPKWNFIKKPNYKSFKKVQNPGKIKLAFAAPCPGSFNMFQRAPDWNELSARFERVSIPITLLFDFEYISNVDAECVQLRLEWLRVERAFSWNRKWRPIDDDEMAKFPNCNRLELLLEEPCDRELRDLHINMLEVIKHPNLHLILDKPIQVRDGYPKRLIKNPKTSQRDDECHEDYWLKRDVEYFAQCIDCSRVETLTCNLEEDTDKSITFKCDKDFLSKFMAFLDTQPIYRGNEWESYMTLKEANKSFSKKRSSYDY